MKYYLSSFRVGDHGSKLVELSNAGPLAFIPNALDHVPPEIQKEWQERNQHDLVNLAISVEVLNLKDYFHHSADISQALSRFSGVWATGGNTFVLRQAMSLSGFDKAIADLWSSSFLYSGYSAGVCVLASDLRELQIVDNPKEFPYSQQTSVIWQGLKLLNHLILPHYKSDHSESEATDKEAVFCKENKIPYRTILDGEVLFGDDIDVRSTAGLSQSLVKKITSG